MAALSDTTWTDRLNSNKMYKGATTKIQIPHRNVRNNIGGRPDKGGRASDAPLVEKDATRDNEIRRVPAENPMTPESPASTHQLRQNKRPSFVEQFYSLYNAGPGEDRNEWLTKLRNLFLGMTPERQEELVQSHSTETKWIQTWCGMVFLSIRKAPKRVLFNDQVCGVRLKHWDLVPIQAYEPCQNCVVAGLVCEYGNRKTTRCCRECRLQKMMCQKLPLDDPSDDENEMENGDVETSTGTGERSSPTADKVTSPSSQTLLSRNRRGRRPIAHTTFLNIYGSGCEPSEKNQWFKEMFDAYTELTPKQQEDVANICGKHDRKKWVQVLAGIIHVNIRAREERPLEGTTVLNADISSWDIHPTYNEIAKAVQLMELVANVPV
ncbi:uncharacterized protein BT62DRAFT_634174 [Guyanagaster necrorhizus]|uniref:Uncharacterized protein n=1 Tax=Guyanagaster necrorhizus TaxID=856835 RepID=A0A9P7VGR9_9AGAR|nr:uncharacterized protein BT62DRAFT_634174 [Guyanagaster necrorhizus MCA 3950]KAG7440273.1 hypothetical protein BT62DRAFT_634174 [Guyanagaster necrorhizus MCA 3950]